MSDRKGDWAQTWSGGKFWPEDPRPEDIKIEDIAHALSMICRYGGHVREFYSVAQHSVLVSRLVPAGLERIGLLHDAAEAYLGDVIRPLKIALAGYVELERRCEAAIDTRFSLDGLLVHQPAAIKRADRIALATERRDVLNPGPGWERSKLGQPLDEVIFPVMPHVAEKLFLLRWKELNRG